MGKIIKKLNAVFFESSLDTTAWLVIGIFTTLLLMITLIAVGFADMVGSMIVQGVNNLLGSIIPTLEGWGTSLSGMMGSLFPTTVNQGTTIAVCIVLAVLIIGGFTFLAVKKPEKLRTVDECATFQ